MLSGTAYTLAYDYEGQLTSITQGGNTISFAYDALGRRFSRTADGTTTRFLPLLEKQGATTTATYTSGNDLIRKDGETFLYDGLGSSRQSTNSSQTVTSSRTYEGFGQTVASSGTSSSPYQFAGTWGYRNDGDAGLMHVGARYYDAQVGRFVTRDTELDQHPYLYCEHDPVNFVDPDGHNPIAKRLIDWIGKVVLPRIFPRIGPRPTPRPVFRDPIDPGKIGIRNPRPRIPPLPPLPGKIGFRNPRPRITPPPTDHRIRLGKIDQFREIQL
jgi:RHS repeat-associated protein